MSTINISDYINKTQLNNSSSKKNENFFEANEILTATIKNKTDENITLNGKNGSITIPSSSVVFGDSDTVSFEVVNNDKNNLTIKQLDVATDTATSVTNSKISQQSSDNVLELFKQANFIVEEDITETDTKKLSDQRAKEVIRKIQNDILFAGNNTSDSAIAELLSSNIDITKITLDILNSVSNEIDKKPLHNFSDEEINDITQKFIDKENISPEGFEQKADIIKSLKDAGLNTTKSNVAQIEVAVLKFETAISNGNLEGLVNLDDISIDSLVKESFSSSANAPDVVSQNEDLYKKLAEKLDIPYTDELKNTFNTFLNKDIEITSENIEKLNNITEKLNITTGDLISKIVANMSNGNRAMETSLVKDISLEQSVPNQDLVAKNLETIKSIANVKQENIANLILNNKILTLNNIRQAVTNNETAEITDEVANTSQKTYKDLLVMMQKMTFETSYKLAKSGIDIDTQTVTEALNSIQNIENKTYATALASASVEATEQNINTISSFVNNISLVSLLNKNYNKLDGNVIINNVSRFSNLFNNSQDAYDVFATKVSNKWNDKVTDYKTQIADILENLGLEATKDNIEASEILIKSKIDITPESILAVKETNLKIDKIMNTMHPKMVADMIKDGVNPLNLNVDEIIDFIDTYENQYGENLSDKIAKNIVNLQKSTDIDSETVSAIKSFYKAMNIILSNNKASIGTSINSEHNLTIKNMLDTAKYFSKTKGVSSMVNQSVGDTVSTITQNEKSITNSIDNAITKSSYEKNLIEKLANVSNNDALVNVYENSENFESELIEVVIEQIEEFNREMSKLSNDQIDVTKYVDKLNRALQSTPFTIELLINNDVDITLDNLATVKELVENPTMLKKRIKSLLEDNEELADTFKEINQDDLTSLSGTGSIIDIQIGEIENTVPETENAILQKSEILSSLNLISLFNKNEETNYSQMVVKLPLSDEVTTVNMFVIDDNFETKQTKTICFNLNTEFLGNIEATLNINSNSADITINGDLNGINYLKENEEEIKELFSSLGYRDVTLNFNESTINSIFNK